MSFAKVSHVMMLHAGLNAHALTTMQMCHAGSKIRSTSILHMAWELLALLVGYKLLHIWNIHTEVELQTNS